MSASAKPLHWLGTSWSDVKSFPDAARHEAGHQLWRAQQGALPDDVKYMGQIGSGVYEIRIHTQVEHRVFFVAKFEEAVYVLHAFQKRTRKTSQRDVDLARRRYAHLVRGRST